MNVQPVRPMKALTLALALCTTVSCFAQKHIKFKTDKATGVKYCFIKHTKKAPTAKDSDIATVIMRYVNDKDSLIFDSRNAPTRRRDDSVGVVMIPLLKSFNGCLEQGMEMMAEGDSAIFSINTDSLFFKTFKLKNLPPYVHKGTYLTFYIKMIRFQTRAQIKEQQQQLIVKHQMEMQQLKAEEAQSIAKYLSDNKLNVQPDADSVYFLSRQNGTGKKIEAGDSVDLLYTGMFLNGKVFDASHLHPKGQELLKVVYEPDMRLIKGWVLALGTMSEGDKVRILLPSSLGYGEHGIGPIPPYSPLLFDIEVVKVVAHK